MRILLVMFFFGLPGHLMAQGCQFTGSDSAAWTAADRDITRERADRALAILEGWFRDLRAAPDSGRRVGWEFLNIGVPNQMNYLRGYLLKQEMELRDAELQRILVARGTSGAASDIDRARAALHDATIKYCTFLRNARWPD